MLCDSLVLCHGERWDTAGLCGKERREHVREAEDGAGRGGEGIHTRAHWCSPILRSWRACSTSPRPAGDMEVTMISSNVYLHRKKTPS